MSTAPRSLRPREQGADEQFAFVRELAVAAEYDDLLRAAVLALRAQRIGIEEKGSLIAGRRQLLKEVILDHTPGRAHIVVITGAGIRADFLSPW